MGMVSGRSIALSTAAGLLAGSSYLIFQRGGLLAWSGATVALVLMAKVSLRPSRADLGLAVTVAVLWGLAWPVTWHLVRSAWESGEVVQIAVDMPSGVHTARLWVVDLQGEPAVYYDAPPQVARALLQSPPLTLTRNGNVTRGCADASLIDDAPEKLLDEMFVLMDGKYGELDGATRLFDSVLGSRRDRTAVLLRLDDCP